MGIPLPQRDADLEAVNQIYLNTARLLTQVAPIVLRNDAFALKGGTAINLFIRDMPRLSVDLDLVLPDHTLSREQALKRIRNELRDSSSRLRKLGFTINVATAAQGAETKLLARRDNIEIKVEVNVVLRGVVGTMTHRPLACRAQEVLQAEVDVPVASLEDVYAGKLVAALDRQHPRDLFDVMLLYQHEGITPAIRRAFVIYLASHDRPIHEVLSPALRDISLDYEGAFKGMTSETVEFERLLDTRERLIKDLRQDLDANERRFLTSLVNAAPDWTLLDVPHAEHLPALQWKLLNLKKLRDKNQNKFAAQAKALEDLLSTTS